MSEDNKILDKIIALIETVARLDTKVNALCTQSVKDIEEVKRIIAEHEEARKDLSTKIQDLEKKFLELKSSYDKIKWMYGALGLIIAPLITALVIALALFLFGKI